jgi:hypothetical protein
LWWGRQESGINVFVCKYIHTYSESPAEVQISPAECVTSSEKGATVEYTTEHTSGLNGYLFNVKAEVELNIVCYRAVSATLVDFTLAAFCIRDTEPRLALQLL